MKPGSLYACYARPDNVSITLEAEVIPLGGWRVFTYGLTPKGERFKQPPGTCFVDFDDAWNHFMYIAELLAAQSCLLLQFGAEVTSPGRQYELQQALEAFSEVLT